MFNGNGDDSLVTSHLVDLVDLVDLRQVVGIGTTQLKRNEGIWGTRVMIHATKPFVWQMPWTGSPPSPSSPSEHVKETDGM